VTQAAAPARDVERERLERLRARLDGLGAATFLVTSPVNVAYATGFESSNAALLVSRDRAVLVTDGRYVAAARAVDGVDVVQSERQLAPDLGRRLGELAEPPVAFESSHLTYAAYEAIAESGLELKAAAGVLEELRAVKDDGELDAIRAAARVTHAAYERLAGTTVVGRTEAEIAWWLAQALHDEGAERLAFPIIVASGPNAAFPHHHAGNRRIERGETVIVDMGATVAGYSSDCTRTFVTGELPEELARAYDVCRGAQAGALAAVRAGAAARGVDAVARSAIADAGYEVLHGLGHGVGLEVHELPRLAETSEGALAARNVVTVEPGVYLPGLGGIRIEDLVIVTDAGPEVLTPFSKDPLELG
jgi:Xaa-Pro aminopeptidase